MLEIAKIKYQSRPTPHLESCTDTLGTLEMHCKLTSEDGAPMPPEYVKEQIAERIWRMAYEELNDPIWKLARLAAIYAPPTHQLEVQEILEKLNALLTRKSPNEKLCNVAAENLNR